VGKVPLLALSDFREDLFVIGEAAGGPVGIGGLAVDGNFKDPAVPLLEVGSDPEFLLDGGLQTGGLGKVVSLSAVCDLDRHRLPPRSFSNLNGLRLDCQQKPDRLKGGELRCQTGTGSFKS